MLLRILTANLSLGLRGESQLFGFGIVALFSLTIMEIFFWIWYTEKGSVFGHSGLCDIDQLVNETIERTKTT